MKDEQIIAEYTAVLQEIRLRLTSLNAVSNILQPSLSLNHEFYNLVLLDGLYSQLRKVCELIAIGIVVAQNTDDRKVARQVDGAYRADVIIKKTMRLNDRCFPRPIIIRDDRQGRSFGHEQPPVFTRDEFKELYLECDRHLHVGRLRLDGMQRKSANQNYIDYWSNRLEAGLATHVIELPGNDRGIFADMRGSEVRCATGDRIR